MTSEPIFLTLQTKKQLTHDVYELEYISENPLNILPGQFLLCDTAGDPKLRRSYSVSWTEGNHIFFIIKRLPEGKGGSIAICDQEIGHTMQVWGPLGHFTLRNTSCPKVFIGTGTGFAPLYFQIRTALKNNVHIPLYFVFGVRELRDMFYLDQIQNWYTTASFDYALFCSREISPLPEKHYLGRVTECLTVDAVRELNAAQSTEFYICGSPAMVTEVRSMLQLYGISEGKVFFEQY